MLAALPAGCLADRYRRDYVLKGAAVLGTIAAATLAIALLYQLPVPSLFGACALLGIYTGFNNAPLEALFADCIPRGKRQVPAPLLVHNGTEQCSVNAYPDMSCRPADAPAETQLLLCICIAFQRQGYIANTSILQIYQKPRTHQRWMHFMTVSFS